MLLYTFLQPDTTNHVYAELEPMQGTNATIDVSEAVNDYSEILLEDNGNSQKEKHVMGE